MDDDVKWAIAREIPHLRRFALALTHDPVQADDLVQDALERALRKRHLLGYRGRLRGWLFKVLYNVFLNNQPNVQKSRHHVSIDDLDKAPLSEPARQQNQIAYMEIVAALHQLPPQQRAAIVLVALEDMPYDEAAESLGIPIGTLRSRLSRGRETLRRLTADSARRAVIRRVK